MMVRTLDISFDVRQTVGVKRSSYSRVEIRNDRMLRLLLIGGRAHIYFKKKLKQDNKCTLLFISSVFSRSCKDPSTITLKVTMLRRLRSSTVANFQLLQFNRGILWTTIFYNKEPLTTVYLLLGLLGMLIKFCPTFNRLHISSRYSK